MQHRSTNWQTNVLLSERTNWVGSQLVCGQHSAAGNHSNRINSVVWILKGWVKRPRFVIGSIWVHKLTNFTHSQIYFFFYFTCS